MQIFKFLSKEIPEELTSKLEEVYKKIKQNFWLGKDEECMEKVGKFVEITTRILEYITSGRYTPFENDLKVSNTLKKFENLSRQEFSDSLRIIIPRVLFPLYTFRNKRGGAHIKNLNPNHIDATFVVSACDWIVAELIRLYHTDEEKEIQNIIDSIVDKQVPIIEEFEEDIKILEPSLPVSQKILLILYRKYPSFVSKKDIKKWIPTKSSSHIPTSLKSLDNKSLIYMKNDKVKLTIKGVKYVEEHIFKKLK